jgi:hypothetical protein
LIEPISLPVDIVEEIERRAKAAGVTPETMARRLVAEELPRLVADLSRTSEKQNTPGPGSRGADKFVLYAPTSPAIIAGRRGQKAPTRARA